VITNDKGAFLNPDFDAAMQECYSGAKAKLYFSAWFNGELAARGCAPAVLVGDSAAQLYTWDNFAVFAMDILVKDTDAAAGVMSQNGFIKIEEHYYCGKYDLAVKFYRGAKPVRICKIVCQSGCALAVSQEDVIIDFLSAARRLNRPKDLEWAIVLLSAAIGRESLDASYLKKRAGKEDVEDALGCAMSKVKYCLDCTSPESDELVNAGPRNPDLKKDVRPTIVEEIDFNDLRIRCTPKKRLKYPDRRELSDRPWNFDQLRMFVRRQQWINGWLAKLGIRIGPLQL
jgi:hypothetical protein